MARKGLKWAITLAVLVVIAYNSVYFKKLDEVKASSASLQFDAAKYARNYLDKKLTPNLSKALDLNHLVPLIETVKDSTFNRYSYALGIGNIRFFLVKGEGEIKSINENDVTVLLKTDTSQRTVKIATEYVFGNAIRDASGMIDINEFSNTMDFNNVSAEINKIIRTEVLPPFKSRAKEGNRLQFTGAVELNREHPDLEKIEVIPIALNIIP
jgi:predicted lipoprotein